VQGGTQGAPFRKVPHRSSIWWDQMSYVSTRARDYGNPELMSKGKESSEPHNSLHIENLGGCNVHMHTERCVQTFFAQPKC
jgi:hypothetical protein